MTRHRVSARKIPQLPIPALRGIKLSLPPLESFLLFGLLVSHPVLHCGYACDAYQTHSYEDDYEEDDGGDSWMLDLISCYDQAIMMHGPERLHYLRAFSLRLLRCVTEESEVGYRCCEHGRLLDTHGAPPLSYDKSEAAYFSRGIFLIYDLLDGEYEIDVLWRYEKSFSL